MADKAVVKAEKVEVTVWWVGKAVVKAGKAVYSEH